MATDNLGEPVLMAEADSRDDAHAHQQRGTRQLLLARSWVFASAYVVSAILARTLGAADYGVYGVVISQLLWLEMLATAGVPGATAKLMAEARHDPGGLERSARALLLSVAVLLLAVCWVLAPHVASLMRIPHGERLFRIAIVDLPFAAVYASYDGMLYGRQRFGVVAVAQVIYSTIKIAGIVALMGLGVSVERALVVSVLATAVVCAVLAARYRLHEFRPVGGLVKEIAALAAPMAIYLVASQVLMNLGLWSLKSLWEGDGDVVGQYVAAANLAKTLTVIPATQAGVLFASVAWALASQSATRARQHIQEATRFAMLLAAAGCIILSLNGADVLSTLFSSVYAGGGRFLPLQLAGFGLFALLDVFCMSLMAAGRQWLVAGAVGALVPLVWLTNYLVVPPFGPMGAASAMLLGVGIAAAVTGALAYRHFGALVRASALRRVLVAAALVGLASATIALPGPLVIVKLAVLGVVYLLALWALGEITGGDFGLPGRRPVDRSA